MPRSGGRVLLTGVGLLLSLSVPSAKAGVINFEGLPDSTIVTTQYPGLTFTNAIILTAGISLNEFEFPPHSGSNVVSDNGGPMTITFSPAIQGFFGYFTYSEPLAVQAFDSHSHVVASVNSHFSNNEALSGVAGSSPNELISVSFAGGISEVTITGDPAGSSFALDDVTISTTAVPTTPAPPTLFLTLVGLCLAVLVAVRRKGRSIGNLISAVVVFSLFQFGASWLSADPQSNPSRPFATSVPRIGVVSVRRAGPATVILTTKISQPDYIPNSGNLLGLSASGILTVLGQMHEDKSGATMIQVPLRDSGRQVQVSAAIRGQIRRALSTPIIVPPR